MASYTGSTQINRMSGFGATATGHMSGSRTAAYNKKSSLQISKNGKRFAVIAAVIFIVVFTLVSLSAYTATLQHENNELQEQNDYLQAEIDSLDSQITEQTKVTKIEKTATDKYGMVYPSAENCITIKDGQESGANLAATIKSEAYN